MAGDLVEDPLTLDQPDAEAQLLTGVRLPTEAQPVVEVAVRLNQEVQDSQRNRGFLQANEGESEGLGHTLEKHVGKSDEYLKDRAPTTPSREASSFKDLATAEPAIAKVLQARSDEIDSWLASGKSAQRFNVDVGPEPVGRVADAEGNVRDSSHVRVVLHKEKETEGYTIRTAFVI